MLYTLTPGQMRAADTLAVERVGDVALMRSAGARIAEVARLYAGGKRIAAFCGPGNNGGDAFAALAVLADRFECVAYAAQTPSRSAARADAESAARKAGVAVVPLPKTAPAARDALRDCALALDGLYGTGSRLPLPDALKPLVEALSKDDVRVLAIDIPSGIDAESGTSGVPCVHASVPVTLGALKPGLFLDPARAGVGALFAGPPSHETSSRNACDLDSVGHAVRAGGRG